MIKFARYLLSGACAASLLAGAAYAQTVPAAATPDTSADTSQVEEVVVTGALIHAGLFPVIGARRGAAWRRRQA